MMRLKIYSAVAAALTVPVCIVMLAGQLEIESKTLKLLLFLGLLVFTFVFIDWMMTLVNKWRKP
jgi:hypothetical protein